MKNKSCVWLVCSLLCVTVMGKAQVVTLENGFALTSMRYKNIGRIMDKIYPYQVSLGIQYLDKGWYNLSSNIGYLSRGEKDKRYLDWEQEDSEFGYRVIGTKIHYLTLNTTFDIKKTSYDGYTFFIGVGPRIDFNLKSTDMFSPDLRDEDRDKFNSTYHSVLFGLKCVGGIRKDFGNLQVGLNFAYLPSFTRLAAVIRDRTFTFGLSLGYRLDYIKDKMSTTRSVRRQN